MICCVELTNNTDFPTYGFGLVKASLRVLSKLELMVCQQNHDNRTMRCKNSDCDVTLVGDVTMGGFTSVAWVMLVNKTDHHGWVQL